MNENFKLETKTNFKIIFNVMSLLFDKPFNFLPEVTNRGTRCFLRSFSPYTLKRYII